MSDVDLGTADSGSSTDNVSMSEALGATLEAAYDAATGPARDDTGKFTGRGSSEPGSNPSGSAPDEIVPEEGTEEAGSFEAGDGQETPEAGNLASETPTIAPPRSMSAADQEAFAKLPPESQKWLTEREKQMTADYTKKSMETAEKSKRFDRLEQVIAPRRQQLAMQGLDESTGIGQLFALSDFAEKDPVGFTRYLLQQRGIDPTQAFSAQPGQELDPALAATQRELNSIKQFISNQQQQQVRQVQSAASSAVEAFVSEADKDGKPLRPHYAKLEPEMIPIVAQLRESQPGKAPAEYLQMAYERAVWANPETRNLMQTEAEAKRLQATKEAAAKAKKVAASNVTSSGLTTGGKAKAGTMMDTLSDAFDRAQGVA